MTEQGSVNANNVVAIAAECMGHGDDILGKRLMNAFVYTLTQLETLPDAVLLYNTGAKLVAAEEEACEDLKTLASHGVRILTCGTCIQYFGLEDKVAVGEVGNMQSIVEILQSAKHVIRP